MTMPIIIVIAVVFFLLIALIAVFITKYRTAGPDEALIVTGSYLGNKNVHVDEGGNRLKIVRGGGTFVLPVFQQAEPLSLLSSKLDVSTPEVYTEQGVPVMADGTAIIKIGGSIGEIATAAEQFLGKSKEDREQEAREVLEGHLRSILGSMTVEEIYKNREKFSQEVQRVASQDLAKMGLVIVSFTIKDVRDKNGYLESLGKPRIAQVKRDADIATAEADKETRIKRAEADKEAKKSELERATEIAEAEKINQLKMAEYRRDQDTAKANADQAYDLETAKARQQVTEQEMQVKIIERQKQIELEEKEILRRERQYDSEVKKKADADRYSVEQSAAAEKAKQLAQADAKKYSIEAMAKAEAERVRIDGLAKAEAEKAKGETEAEVIRLKGLAEAEAKEKIAAAFEQYGQAAIFDMIVKMLPEYAKQVSAPLSNIDKITVVDTGGNGDSSGANKVTGYATNLMSTLQESLKASSGIDVKEMIENFSGKGNIKQSINELTNELKETKPVQKSE
ncbi:flotillin lipid rafts scaffold protein FloT [Bacillus halotolerans]|uniref:Flotillin lipid rafts scaffold protein FloT n=1 Tax=Bacillus halotolerans TaxID=260554 RepID=A0ABY7HYZ3_9BACI|nr:flotillin lipid rafts scaffold protein FloT [Bacillus halotolerans]QQF61877.1 flotillin lipid rafts scaffold protein FloT [Bacillus mojavensis]MBJ7571962.1 flotillin lipid rafts scaffold protein FloT [Bacillus halotolerans]MCR6596350.1 flotillin lipid rafts scaffold protein FloT [Bacillus halotolerans]MDG0765275.1 flotillin lipid rafts scaffold protein FloT [Bacillus halotolerans]MEC0251172.1 flotillin lipid rafts scaffold protein FloT [Bacillus halotolerans]